MNKRFSNIIFISALAILSIILGINITNGFRNIDIKNIYGNRSELGDVDVSVKKNLGIFFLKNYNFGANSITSKTMFRDENEQGIDVYKNKDALRGIFISQANSYDGKDFLAVVNPKYGTNILELLLKDKKTGKIKKALVENDGGSYIISVYAEKDIIKILMPENDEESCSLVIKEYNFETKGFNTIEKFGSYCEKVGLEYKDGNDFYIEKIVRNYNEKKEIEEIKDLNIYKVNLKENTFEDYDVKKILEKNKIDLTGKNLESAECDGNLIYVKISDLDKWENLSKDKNEIIKYNGIKSKIPKTYSIATINIKDLKVNYYKDIIDENRIEEYTGSITELTNLRIFNDKLYFASYTENGSLLVIGVVNLKNSELVYLGEFNNVVLNGFYDKK
ncbi:hypothetical protein [Clostridium sp.]|uniref:hypothetical protein n=1 Tax=Clostridium sp. TaxID=1506 RepID=UPI00262D1332